MIGQTSVVIVAVALPMTQDNTAKFTKANVLGENSSVEKDAAVG